MKKLWQNNLDWTEFCRIIWIIFKSFAPLNTISFLFFQLQHNQIEVSNNYDQSAIIGYLHFLQ